MNGTSELFAEAVATVAPSVVRVEGRRRYPLSGVAWSEELVVTTSRAVECEEGIKVGLDDGRLHDAEFVGSDPRLDLALLRVGAGSLQQAGWSEDEPKVGQVALIVGRPSNGVRASLGIVSSLEGEWRTYSGGKVDSYLTTDAKPFAGFSGGPLITGGGEVLGINTAALTRTGSVTLPPAAVRRTVDELLAHGKVRRGYVGIAGQLVLLPREMQESVGQRSGVLVMSVEPDSPAAGAGLTLGDTLLEIAGEKVGAPGDLFQVLDGARIGESVTVRYLRGGEEGEASLTVGERP
ncbi:MAG TPA: S1C family serine protease [Trueperaceae bacterium]